MIAPAVDIRFGNTAPSDHRTAASLECRVVVFQPALARYRRPVFRRLGQRVGSLTLVHGERPLPGEVPASDEGLEGVHTVAVAHTRRGPAFWMPAMWRVAGEDRHDVAVFSWNTRYPHLPLAMLRARRSGMGVALWGHGYSIRNTRIRRSYRNLLTRFADAIITYNRRAASDLMLAGIPRNRIFVAPNALDGEAIDAAAAAWTDTAERMRQFQERLGVLDRPVALFVSRLGSLANLRVLIDTWRMVVTAAPQARLVIVGDGPARKGLEHCIDEHGLEASVACVGPVFGEEAIAPYFLTARLLLHPVRIGLALNHAMGYGVPVVTFDDASLHGPEFEALRHGANGLSARHGDVEALAGHATHLLLHGQLAASFGREAKENMRSGYGLDGMVDGFVEAVRCAHAAGARRQQARGWSNA